MRLEDLPDPVRRLMAYRYALETLGFDVNAQTWSIVLRGDLPHQVPTPRVIWVGSAESPATPHRWLMLTISVAGIFNKTDVVIAIGAVDEAAWLAIAPPLDPLAVSEVLDQECPTGNAIRAVYNALPQAARVAERLRYVDIGRHAALALSLIERGVMPPAMVGGPPAPGRN